MFRRDLDQYGRILHLSVVPRGAHATTMQIADEALDEFIAKEEFREEIDRTEALDMATDLLTLYELLARKLPRKRPPASDLMPYDDRPPIGYADVRSFLDPVSYCPLVHEAPSNSSL
jgi:hypothetical protein